MSAKNSKVALALTAVTVLGVSVWAWLMTQEKRIKNTMWYSYWEARAQGRGRTALRLWPSLGTHLSAGDLLRDERNSGSKLATMINNYIAEGKIGPAEVTVGLLLKAMDAAPTKSF